LGMRVTLLRGAACAASAGAAGGSGS
jgi:hypothetical protein